MNNFQREGAKDNSTVGRAFEGKVKEYFSSNKRIELQKNFRLEIGISEIKKFHSFDLGINNHKDQIIIECKSHTWTQGNNTPSAKISAWHQAMYYFYMASNNFEKIFIAEKSYSDKYQKTLVEYYLKNHPNMIPKGVKIMEFDLKKGVMYEIN